MKHPSSRPTSLATCLAFAVLTLALPPKAHAIFAAFDTNHVDYAWVAVTGTESSGLWQVGSRSFPAGQGSGGSMDSPLTFRFFSEFAYIDGVVQPGMAYMQEIFVPQFTLTDDRELLLPQGGFRDGSGTTPAIVTFTPDASGLVTWESVFWGGPHYNEVAGSGTGYFARVPETLPLAFVGVVLAGLVVVGRRFAQR